MKTRRGMLTWTALAVCAALVLGAMVWLTRSVLAAGAGRALAQSERIAAETRADLEERTRLALWRMDALGAALMLRENRVPENYYSGSAPAGAQPVETPEVRLRFELRQGREPFFPKSNHENQAAINRLKTLLSNNPLPGDEWVQVNGAVDAGEQSWNALPKQNPNKTNESIQQNAQTGMLSARQQKEYQLNSNLAERAMRAKAVASQVDNDTQAFIPPLAAPAQLSESGGNPPHGANEIETPPVTELGQMRGVWLADELFLMRKVIRRPAAGLPSDPAPDPTVVHCVWLDSAALRHQLLAEVADLLPDAHLTPVTGEQAVGNPLALVSCPFLLERSDPPAPPPAAKVRFGAPLWVAWGAVAAAILTSTLLVGGVMKLSERRASFVSAVTHELRTPLTTFRLYSEMLESGAVKEEKRGNYLRVLSREADRLSHLVENVLAFSRIERGTARSNVRETTVGAMLESFRERFEARLATAGMTLAMDTTSTRPIRVDTAAVEHILFNLLDNAAKYASSGNPARVEITTVESPRAVHLLVRDHGPGIAPEERRRIFRAFHKSASEAAESQPGVGLGLALSRRLARGLGGDLDCAGNGPGACFRLTLPRA